MEKLLPPDDFILWLEAEHQGVPEVGRKLRAALPRRRLVDVVQNAAPSREQPV